MGKSIHHSNVFSGGEVSPKVDARVDQQKYGSWLRQCANMIPYKTGGLTRAVGTQYVNQAKLGANYAVRLMPFIFSPQVCFTLEFGHQYIRFYSGGGTANPVTVSSAPAWISGSNYVLGNFVTGTFGVIYYCILSITNSTLTPSLDSTHFVAQNVYEVPSPYSAYYTSGLPSATDIFGVVPDQTNDVIDLVHPDYAPYTLSRYGNTDWVMEQVPFAAPALLDQNATSTTLTPTALQGIGITVQASAPAWIAENWYTLADSVQVNGIIYDCVLSNVSAAAFATDLAAGYWNPVGVFNQLHVGSTWQLAVLRQSAYVEYDGTAASGFSAGTSDQIQCLGSYEVHTYGVWSADIAIQRSLDGGITWNTVTTVTGRSDRNVDIQGTAVVLGIYRLVISNVSVPINPGATNPRVVFECDDAFLYGTFEVTAVVTIAATAIVITNTVQILTLGNSNWTSFGAPANYVVGTIFTATGSGTGTGTAINPYAATATVVTQLTDPNPLQPQWVSGTSYVTSNQVNYQFINYTCLGNVSGSTPPPQDPTHWAPNNPGGTEYWSEAAWSNYRGFPQAVGSFQQRKWYGSSGFEPQRMWGTVTNDLRNLALGDQTLATDAVVFDLNAPGRGPIVWIAAQTDLFAGLSGAEWVINSGAGGGAISQGTTSGGAITPTNLNAFEQGTYGSAPSVQPRIVGNAVMFTQRQSDAIRQMFFSVTAAKYMSTDLTVVADHLFSSGIVQMAYQPRWRHQSILWAVTQQGTLCGLTYELDQEVFGWFHRSTGYGAVDGSGNAIASDYGFESVCVIDGNGTADDEVWVVANRFVNGVQTRFIERINPNNWEETFTGPPNPPAPVLSSAYYVDAGRTIVYPSALTLNYLPNRWVVGLANGCPFGPVQVASNGTIPLPGNVQYVAGVTIQIGLPIGYIGQPMRFDMDAQAGNTQARTKQAADWYIRVWNSAGGMIGNGSVLTPQWVSGTAYTPGQNVISPAVNSAFQCVVATSGSADPSTAPLFWAPIATPSYQPPVKIPFTNSQANPFGVPVLITTPTDIRIPAQLQNSPNHDPTMVVQGSDALPLTALALFSKIDIISQP